MILEKVIAPLVEGYGEVEAVPVLIRRIAAALPTTSRVGVTRPIRVPKGRLLKEGELERYLNLASTKVSGGGGVLILLDADDSCPAKEAPKLLARAQTVLHGTPVGVVLAKREFEAWFLAAASSLQGTRGLPRDLKSPDDPEAIRGAKEWLSNLMPPSRSYSPPVDQAALTTALDLDLARNRSASFDKCLREVERLLREGSSP